MDARKRDVVLLTAGESDLLALARVGCARRTRLLLRDADAACAAGAGAQAHGESLRETRVNAVGRRRIRRARAVSGRATSAQRARVHAWCVRGGDSRCAGGGRSQRETLTYEASGVDGEDAAFVAEASRSACGCDVRSVAHQSRAQIASLHEELIAEMDKQSALCERLPATCVVAPVFHSGV